LTVLARTQNKSTSTHGQTTESNVKQESEEKNDTDAYMEYGQREQRQGLGESEKALKCGHCEEYRK